VPAADGILVLDLHSGFLKTKAKRPGIFNQPFQMQDQCFSLYSKAQLIIKIQFHNNLQQGLGARFKNNKHLLPEHPCFEHTQILTELV
jgi:hypothetical protein